MSQSVSVWSSPLIGIYTEMRKNEDVIKVFFVINSILNNNMTTLKSRVTCRV